MLFPRHTLAGLADALIEGSAFTVAVTNVLVVDLHPNVVSLDSA